MISMPSLLISGGQTGADLAALDFAITHGLAHGGFCPRGRRNEGGVIPDRYNLTEIESSDYKVRTQRNVVRADATVIFNEGDRLSTGSICALNAAKHAGRPTLILRNLDLSAGRASVEDSAFKMVAFCGECRPATLNVAGNRESSAIGMSEYVRTVLGRAYELAKTLTPEAVKGVMGTKDPYGGEDLFGALGQVGGLPKNRL